MHIFRDEKETKLMGLTVKLTLIYSYGENRKWSLMTVQRYRITEWLYSRSSPGYPYDVIEHVHSVCGLLRWGWKRHGYQSSPEGTPSSSILANPPPFMRTLVPGRRTAWFYLVSRTNEQFSWAKQRGNDSGRVGRWGSICDKRVRRRVSALRGSWVVVGQQQLFIVSSKFFLIVLYL